MMVQRFRLRSKSRRRAAPLFAALVALTASMFAPHVTAQTNYTCFPSCSETDGRFLAIAGAGNNAFAGDWIDIGFGVPSTATTLQIGIFDGETGGTSGSTPVSHWDKGTTPLTYTLYADPAGDGSGTELIGTWSGSDMTDNGWYTINVTTSSAAQASGTHNYVYRLHVVSSQPDVNSISSFKLRTNGTITIKSQQSFSIYSPLTGTGDAGVIFPSWPSTTTTTYDGSWQIFLDVPSQSSALEVWDGDMDFGKFDGSTMDTDDPNTSGKPSWATSSAVDEGVAVGDGVRIGTSTTASTTEFTSGSPSDDNQSTMFARTPSIAYEVISPDGTHYQNNNPSGNLEWEKYLIDTQPYSASVNDIHADQLPAGLYQVHMTGMDMGNINSWRFFNDITGVSTPDCQVVGVDVNGDPMVPIRAVELTIGRAAGIVYYDTDANGVQGTGEPGIPSVTVTLTQYDASGTLVSTTTTTTDATGAYSFSNLGDGSYRITVDATTLQDDVIETSDPDGTTTSNYSSFSLLYPTTIVYAGNFGYERTPSGTTSGGGGSTSCPGTGTRGYWLNHPDDWPTLPSVNSDGVRCLTLGDRTYTSTQLIAILKRPTKGDRTYAMAAQLIAAKLNWLANPCYASQTEATVVACLNNIDGLIDDADTWLTSNPVGGGCTTSQWSTGSTTHDGLDDFNNGVFDCAPHRLN